MWWDLSEILYSKPSNEKILSSKPSNERYCLVNPAMRVGEGYLQISCPALKVNGWWLRVPQAFLFSVTCGSS